jgi:hypothetical protein
MGGAHMGGGSPAVGGAQHASGGSPAAMGGERNASGGTQNATGGAPMTGGTQNTIGGSPANTGGTQSATGGTPFNTGGAQNATGGPPAMSGGTENASGGSSAMSGGTENASGSSSATSGGSHNATGGSPTGGGATQNATGGTPTQSSGGSIAGGAGGSSECDPPIPEGTVFKVSVLQETASSDRCHIVNAAGISPFTITAGKTEDPECSTTPAVAPPKQTDVVIVSCVPAAHAMLGVYCHMVYKAGCDGHMLFSFVAPPGTDPNWGGAVIDNVLFRIEDYSPNCFADSSNCLDEYTAELERVQ